VREPLIPEVALVELPPSLVPVQEMEYRRRDFCRGRGRCLLLGGQSAPHLIRIDLRQLPVLDNDIPTTIPTITFAMIEKLRRRRGKGGRCCMYLSIYGDTKPMEETMDDGRIWEHRREGERVKENVEEVTFSLDPDLTSRN
jgi:hypothetical protein